jgi:mono/diheme cytochrome c family protein
MGEDKDRRRGVGAACLVLAAAVAAACGQQPPPPTQTTAAADPGAAVARGKYLVTTSGCNDCHTTKKMGPNGPELDMSMLLAGHPEAMKMPPPPKIAPNDPWAIITSPTLTAWSGPWGESFAANLTPDQNTGLGNWTEDMFVKAIRTGKHMGVSRQILPPMPWQEFAQMTDADLKAIYAYLRTIPPVTNHVPDPIPPAGAPGS